MGHYLIGSQSPVVFLKAQSWVQFCSVLSINHIDAGVEFLLVMLKWEVLLKTCQQPAGQNR